MALTVDVPDVITTAQREAACRALGLDPDRVQSVSFDANSYKVDVVVWATSADAAVRVEIPVRWVDAATPLDQIQDT